MTFSSLCAERLKAERSRLSLNQAEIAEQVGVTRETWGKYERGQMVPGGDVLFSFAGLGADIQYILTGKRQTLEPRALALLDNLEHMSDDDRRCIERLAFSLSKSALMNKTS